MALSLDTTPQPGHAAEACRLLIRAYAVDPQHVDWSDVQDALAEALAAFGLTPDAFEIASQSPLSAAET